MRWLAIEHAWIERGDDGRDHVVAGGRRLGLEGMTIAEVGPAAPEVDGGARMPSWAPAGPVRYVFWKGNKLYGAATFIGELRPLATLPAEPRASFDWISGIGLSMQGGVIVVPPAGGPLQRVGVPATARALAVDARRALAISAFGRARLTTDGGATFRDVSSDLGGAASLEVRGDEILAVLLDGRERLVSTAGTIVEGGIGHVSGPPRGRRPPGDPDLFSGESAARAFDAAVHAGLAIDDGGVVVAGAGVVGRLDPEAGRTTSVAALDPGLELADCTAFRAADGPLLACVGEGRAAVVDLHGAPRTERTFDLTNAPEIDRFVGVDGEALGYLGACDGAPEVSAAEVSPNGEPYNAFRQRSAVFCVRATRDTWIEHRLDPADAADVIAWIPRVGGGAAALVARPGTFLDDRERVSVRGALRVVRVARSEPPLSVTAYGWSMSATLDRSLRIGADDVIEGWLGAGANGSGPIAITIDAAGHPRAFPAPPRLGAIVPAGRFALARAEDGNLWETIDGGHRWAQVDAPPGGSEAQPSACSPVGCRVGPFVRLGWSNGDGAEPVRFDGAQAIALRDGQRSRRPTPSPVVRLACAFDGPPESKRVPDSGAFGYTKTPSPRGGVTVRIGTLGMATVPYSAPQTPLTGDVQLGWVAPLDVEGKVRRATVSTSQLAASSGGHRSYEMRLGWLLTPDGGLDTFSIGASDHCHDRLLTAAGITRPMGGCLHDAVAVDSGGRIVLLQASHESIVISASSAPAKRAAHGRVTEPRAPARDLASTRVGSIVRGFAFGVGTRAGSPVAVSVDLNGDAALVPIDPDRGALGVEERLRPLSEATLGSDATCAPRPDDARVVLPFEGAIDVDRSALRGVIPTGAPGVAVIRWSRDRACLDAVEIPVRDERFEEGPGSYEPPGTVRKLVARFGGSRGAARAALISISLGGEVRQRLSCTSMAAVK
ncbi:Hypothetical protein A7982_05972 [Minicystis rosea]|nr:Hypothetical protein A7982_05972 [Minicystis rosea]